MSSTAEVGRIILESCELVFMCICWRALPHVVEAETVESVGVGEQVGVVADGYSRNTDVSTAGKVCSI